MVRRPPSTTLSPYTTLFRSRYHRVWVYGDPHVFDPLAEHGLARELGPMARYTGYLDGAEAEPGARAAAQDRKSTRLNSSHQIRSYAVFRVKKKKQGHRHDDG